MQFIMLSPSRNQMGVISTIGMGAGSLSRKPALLINTHAIRFSCKVGSPGAHPSLLYNSRLTCIQFFVFSPKSKRDPISQAAWCLLRTPRLNVCHFWQTELSSPHPNLDNEVKSERKSKLPKKSHQRKTLKQEGTHFTPSIQRKCGGFILPFFPSDCTILSWFFPISLWEGLPKTK